MSLVLNENVDTYVRTTTTLALSLSHTHTHTRVCVCGGGDCYTDIKNFQRWMIHKGILCVFVLMCLCACVCVRERERERNSDIKLQVSHQVTGHRLIHLILAVPHL